jgi:hypothetical protein
MPNSNAKLTVKLSTVGLLICCAALSASGQKPIQNLAHYTNLGGSSEASSSIATLYALDPLASSLCFADGREGGIIQHGGVYNRCSHISFDHYNTGGLTVAIEGGEQGAIIDLGSADDLKKEYGYNETGGNGQGFASITFRDGVIMIRKAGKDDPLQELVEGARLFPEVLHSSASAIARPGHIYLARIFDPGRKDFQILVKLLVLKATPGDSVTFRWELL